MARILFRIFFSYFLIAILRGVEKRFGIIGILALVGFIFVSLFALRFLPHLLRSI